MRILLLVSAFNGLTQRVWCDLKEGGHDVGVVLAPVHDDSSLVAAVDAIAPDLILCPFLKHRVPEPVWGRYPTVVIHPGPLGDRGPSSLDHATLDGRDRWGVTALSAVEAMDAGPVWATETFPMPEVPIAKSSLYNGPVADAAMVCVEEVLRMVEAGEAPLAVEEWPVSVEGTGELPLLRRQAFEIDWAAPAIEIARRIAAADGAPGAPANIDGKAYCLFDAATTSENHGAPGTVVGCDTDSVAIATGEGTLWVGYAATLGDKKRGPKLPAAWVLETDHAPYRPMPEALAETTYERDGDVGYLTIRSYSGAMHTQQCRRLTDAVRKALVEDTMVLVVRGTEHAFSNGIHLGVIEAAPDPAAEAWDNIRAIDELCLAIAEAEQLTIAAFTANAGAGGVMAGLCADVTVARSGVVLNPYYDMGIFGSELHTWGLPSRVGEEKADELLGAKLPISAAEAHRIGMISEVGPRDAAELEAWLRSLAQGYTEPEAYVPALAARESRRACAMPMSYYQSIELAEMARDIFEDRYGFAAKRKAFVTKAAPSETPAKILF
ncbi:MAG: enoyl-CoA hydratase-related protein [Nocardioides sp.]|uniref:enoyl-CoA hydratase-related protein n=1 Tax=Nocardioides sp. TaxID=35761 RepID=UPI003D6AB43D